MFDRIALSRMKMWKNQMQQRKCEMWKKCGNMWNVKELDAIKKMWNLKEMWKNQMQQTNMKKCEMWKNQMEQRK